MVDKMIDEKRAVEIKKICNPLSHNRTRKMKITQLKVEDVFGDILNKDSISPERAKKWNICWAEMT